MKRGRLKLALLGLFFLLPVGASWLIWSLDLAPQWVIVGNLEGRRLQGDAAHSPLTERRSNYYATVGLAYRF